MRIKILTCCAGLNFSLFAGETVDIDDALAKDLIQAGHAEEVKTGGKGDKSAERGAGDAG